MLADIDGPRTEVPELAGQPRPDLILLNDDDLTYAIIRFDDRSVATLTQAIGAMTDSLARAVCWTSVLDMVNKAELAVPGYVTMVAGGIAGEQSVAALQSLLEKCWLVLQRLADPAWVASGQQLLAARAEALLRAAEPGSDHQLAWAQLLSWSATSPGELDLLAGLLDGELEVAGLAVDSELRWALLRRLAAARADWRRPDRRRARPRTTASTGQREAAACRAAIGDAAHKEAAWRLLTDAAELNSGLLRSVAFAFHQPEQAGLLAPYAARYFDDLPRIWAAVGGHLRRSACKPRPCSRTRRPRRT